MGYLVSGMLGESHCFLLKEALLSLLGSVQYMVTWERQTSKVTTLGMTTECILTADKASCGMDGMLLPLCEESINRCVM